MAAPLTLEVPTLDDVLAARETLRGVAVRTPLVRLTLESAPAPAWLKLENLQPMGSFKLRGAVNAMAAHSVRELVDGVWTASAGNMAQGVAWRARELGIPCHVVAPDHAPATKLRSLERLGAVVQRVPFAEWFRILETHEHPGMRGVFIHPVCDRAVMAGNGTIGLEILEELPDVEAILVPYGGGGLSCGIAAAVAARAPHVRVYACEVETAAPLAASLAAGQPVPVEYRASFVDGIGSPFILPPMWPLASALLAGSLVVTIEQVAEAIRGLAERHRAIAEGAGAVSVAVALAGLAGARRVACVVSGGNLDNARLVEILAGRVPS
jgi:threonine dehydratase